MNECYKIYLDYLFGNIIETKPTFTYSETKHTFFKNDEFPIILELSDGRLFIKEDTWYSFQYFFDLSYSETRLYLSHYFCKKLNLIDITPTICKRSRQRAWY